MKTKQPLDGGRNGRPEDLDGAAVFFMSDASKFSTGQTNVTGYYPIAANKVGQIKDGLFQPCAIKGSEAMFQPIASKTYQIMQPSRIGDVVIKNCKWQVWKNGLLNTNPSLKKRIKIP